MSPLNWYSRTRQWDLAPGYKADDPRRFDRRVTDDCLHCHTGRVAVKGRSLNKYSNPAFHEMSIGCENCHGPGEQHVLFQNSESPADVLTDPIVNPKHLDHDRRESVCYQCHLGGVVRTLRFGRSEFDFRPGQRIEDIWLVLEADSGIGEDGRTKSVSHVQQMQMSRCYTESAGRFGCVSCHDPHRVPSLSERPDYYRRKCFECHDNSSCSLSHELRMEEENSCISCHMPVRDSSNMAHVVQTDHRVIRSLKIVQRSGFDQDPDQLQIHDRENSQLDDQEKNRALGLGSWLFLTKKGRHPPTALARTLLSVLEKSPNDGAVLTVLGSLASQNGLTTQARDYYERARNIPDAREAALGGLLNIYYLSSEWNKALECANALIEIDSGNARFHAIKADTLSNLGKTAEGIESAKRALALNPTLTSVRQWLVKTLHSAGRDKERNAQEQILKRMRNARAPD